MRDALSLTDQAIAFGNQKLAASDVSNMLGTIDQRDIERLVNALVERDGPGLLSEINRISDFAPDYGNILADLLSLFHRVTMEQVVPGSADNSLGDAAEVQTLARRLSAEDAQLFYQAALMGRKDLAVTPDARMGFEMTLLRMLAFRPGTDRREPPAVGASTARETRTSSDEPDPAPPAEASATSQPAPTAPAEETSNTGSESPANDVASPPIQTAEPAPAAAAVESGLQSQDSVSGDAKESEPASAPASAPERQSEDDAWLASLDAQASAQEPVDEFQSDSQIAPDAEPADVPPWEDPVSTEADAIAESPKPEPEPAPEPVIPQPAENDSETPEPALAEQDGEFVWERDFRTLGIVGMPGNLASHGALSWDGDTVVLTIDDGHARLLNARHEEKIVAGLRNRFGDTTDLRVVPGNPGPHTPAAYEERQRKARQQAAEEAIRNDPAVQSIVERFEARVVEDSIRPIESTKR